MHGEGVVVRDPDRRPSSRRRVCVRTPTQKVHRKDRDVWTRGRHTLDRTSETSGDQLTFYSNCTNATVPRRVTDWLPFSLTGPGRDQGTSSPPRAPRPWAKIPPCGTPSRVPGTNHSCGNHRGFSQVVPDPRDTSQLSDARGVRYDPPPPPRITG